MRPYKTLFLAQARRRRYRDCYRSGCVRCILDRNWSSRNSRLPSCSMSQQTLQKGTFNKCNLLVVLMFQTWARLLVTSPASVCQSLAGQTILRRAGIGAGSGTSLILVNDVSAGLGTKLPKAPRGPTTMD